MQGIARPYFVFIVNPPSSTTTPPTPTPNLPFKGQLIKLFETWNTWLLYLLIEECRILFLLFLLFDKESPSMTGGVESSWQANTKMFPLQCSPASSLRRWEKVVVYVGRSSRSNCCAPSYASVISMFAPLVPDCLLCCLCIYLYFKVCRLHPLLFTVFLHSLATQLN